MRLATLICELVVVSHKTSPIVRSFYELEDYLDEFMGKSHLSPAFISGPRRTVDVDRVLSLGVHAPR